MYWSSLALFILFMSCYRFSSSQLAKKPLLGSQSSSFSLLASHQNPTKERGYIDAKMLALLFPTSTAVTPEDRVCIEQRQLDRTVNGMLAGN